MSKKFLTLVAVGTLVSVGTYVTLNLLWPYHKQELAHEASISVDEVFSGNAPTPASDTADSTPATSAEPAEAIPAAASEPAAEPAPAAAEAPTTAEPPPAEPVAAAEPEPEPAPAAPPAPAPKPKAKPSAPAAPAAKSEPAPAPAASATASNWWGKNDPAALSLVYAGSASYEKAVALLFNGNFGDAAEAAQHLEVSNGKGKVSGQWKLSPNNSQMLVFPVSASGTYTVVAKKGLKDQRGRSLQQDLRGPVTIK